MSIFNSITCALDEVWKDVVGLEGQYRVSNKGRVWSIARVIRKNGKTGIVRTKDVILSQKEDQKGYLRVNLNEHGVTKYRVIHRLVAKAFIPNPENKPQVNHIDGNKKNNNLENLEWCTNSENQKHAFRLGLNYVTGRAGRKKIPVKQINADTGEVIKTFGCIADAARECNIPGPNIRKVIYGERQKAGGFSWKRG